MGTGGKWRRAAVNPILARGLGSWVMENSYTYSNWEPYTIVNKRKPEGVPPLTLAQIFMNFMTNIICIERLFVRTHVLRAVACVLFHK